MLNPTHHMHADRSHGANPCEPRRLAALCLLIKLAILAFAPRAAAQQPYLLPIDCAVITATPWDIGHPLNVFDGDPNTLYRSANINPAFIQVVFPGVATLHEFNVLLTHSGPGHNWMIETAMSVEDMDSQSGTYAVAVPWTFAPDWVWTSHVLKKPIEASVVRLWAEKLLGDNFVHINECEIIGMLDSMPPPSGQYAVAGNSAVHVAWNQPPNAGGVFSHYNVYRATSPFNSVVGMLPIAAVFDIAQTSYTDQSAENGVGYHYAVTSVTQSGGEMEGCPGISSIGPRTPRDETDLQVVSISRTPRYPRYWATYTNYTITEPSGFGPYHFSAATGLGGGQNANTQRWPDVGDTVTYTATVRNRGTNSWIGQLPGAWRVNGKVVKSQSQPVSIDPGETIAFSLDRTWDGGHHDIAFDLDVEDDRNENNSLAIDSRSVAFLSFVDVTYIEDFRESTPNWPGAATDDFLDWVNRHMARFNQLFAEAGTGKRVHMDILEVLHDAEPDPQVETIDFAIFPFRFRAGDVNLRTVGYYSEADDIDYGLLHEKGHQLGLIDLYRLNLPANGNHVSGTGYNAAPCLMNGVSHFVSLHSAQAMEHWLETAHGYYGQYLYRIPSTVQVQFLGHGGAPLDGATVRVYQKVERPGMGEVLTGQVKAEGVTDESGLYVLPNVPIDPNLVPPAYNGDVLSDNPFGYVAVVGNNGLLLLEVEHNGYTDYAWLDIVEVNVAYALGDAEVATFQRELGLGGPIQTAPPNDMAEMNAAHWTGWADAATYELYDDVEHFVVGSASIRAETDGGFDTYARYPGALLAQWNLTNFDAFNFWAYAENDNIGFQERSPWIRLRSADGWIDIKPAWDVLNTAIDNWVHFEIPLDGDGFWERTETGEPDITAIRSVEIHADTWGSGFTLWLDGVGFSPPLPAGDLNGDGVVDVLDLLILLDSWGACPGKGQPCPADFNNDGSVDVLDLLFLLDNWG